jgi:N-acetylglucosamine kinase-like BadF-type ATPase
LAACEEINKHGNNYKCGVMFFLGIDGGASKTTAVIINESGRIISRKLGRESNHSIIGIKEAEKHLYNLIKKFGKKKISYACFGIAGIDSKRQYLLVYSRLKKGRIGKLLKCPIILLNDTQIIMPSIDKENGIAVIGGTGCNFYAKNNKKEARASGLGHIQSDQGSAYDIATMVLKSAVKSFDGRGRKTLLEKMVMKKARIKNIRDIVNVMPESTGKKDVASYAPLAEKAAKKGDAVAKKILSAAADEYVLGIRAVAKRTGLKRFDVALVGSVFNVKLLLNRIKNRIKARVFIVKEPALGAAKLAMRKYYRK